MTEPTNDANGATIYRIGLTPASVERIVTWLDEDRPNDDHKAAFPLRLTATDVAVLGDAKGADREAACTALMALDATSVGDPWLGGRLALAQDAARAGVELELVTMAATYIGHVPVKRRLEFKIG